jgi:hypothetical protein
MMGRESVESNERLEKEKREFGHIIQPLTHQLLQEHSVAGEQLLYCKEVGLFCYTGPNLKYEIK